jgi:hypothetical protein
MSKIQTGHALRGEVQTPTPTVAPLDGRPTCTAIEAGAVPIICANCGKWRARGKRCGAQRIEDLRFRA